MLRFRTAIALAAVLLMPLSALAKDALKATATTSGFVFTENGNPIANGTYAVGTLKIYMVVSATEWPQNLGDVLLDLAVKAGPPSSPPTKYGTTGVPIRLRQAGGDLILTPVPQTHNVMSVAWTGSSLIGVSVPQSILDDPAFNEDGTELVANLQIEPTKSGLHLDTVTTVKIYAKLVHPAATCLRTVAFVSDNGLSGNLSLPGEGLTLKYKFTGPSTSPTFNFQGVNPSQTLMDVLVVNSCNETKTLDLDLGIDSAFSVPTTGQPLKAFEAANAAANQAALIDTFAELQVAYPADFGSANNFGNSIGNPSFCLANLSVGSMKTIYARADIELITSSFSSLASLPAVGTVFSGFSASPEVAGGSCGGGSHPDSDGPVSTSTIVKAHQEQ